MSLALKKTWTWLKHNWYVPALVILVILFISPTHGVKSKFFDMLMSSRKRYKEELDTIKNNNKEKEENKNKIVKEHKEALDKIEKDFDIKIDTLETEKQKEISTILEKHKDKPGELAKEIASLLGAEHVE
jgi:O6-methylguanine-DNA--protein-cysteine methyltransferase